MGSEMCIRDSYKHFNKVVFDNRLPQANFMFRKTNRSAGYYKATWGYARLKHIINISRAYVDKLEFEDLAEILLHEMLHLWFDINGIKDIYSNGTHNWRFRLLAYRLGIPCNRDGVNMGRIDSIFNKIMQGKYNIKINEIGF